MATNPEPAGRRAYFGGPSLTEKRLTKRMVFVVALVAGMLGCRGGLNGPRLPPCNQYCADIVAYAVGRASGPLPHDCRFFRECGCAFQCEGDR